MRKHDQGMHSGGGFTLLELLIVITVIGILIGLLLPALKKSKAAADQVRCGSNLHQIYIAMSSYLIEFNTLPRLTRQLDARPPFETERDLTAPWWLAPVIWHVNAPGSGGTSQFVNFGRLWSHQFVDNVHTFYCPTQTHPEFRFNTPLNPWPPATERQLGDEAQFKIWNDVFASYTRRPGLSFIHFELVPPGTAIVNDVNMFPPYVRTNHNGLGFNVLATDGGVRFVRDGWFYEDNPDFQDLDVFGAVRHILDGYYRLDR